VSESDPLASTGLGCGTAPSATGVGVPCATITIGLQRAFDNGKDYVVVADGNYPEFVDLRNGIDLYGGYRADTWERHVDTTATVISGAQTVATFHDRTVIALNIASSTTFEGFLVRGSFNSKVGGNSYAVYVSNSPGLILSANYIFGGRGGTGDTGDVGGNGTPGGNGAGRNPDLAVGDAAYDAKIATGTGFCDPAPAQGNNRQITNRGTNTCPGSDIVNGGNGGGNDCPPADDQQTQQSGNPGIVGEPGNPGGAGGTSGVAGYDAVLDNQNICYIPLGGLPHFGGDGGNGITGSNGITVSGCSTPNGSVSGGHWTGGTALDGLDGTAGGGGAGGGGGGGGFCWYTGCPGNKDRLGGHGGGGGAGGCGGEGGGRGQTGGGVFGIFVVGAAPSIVGNTIIRGDGGTGGRGGSGGAGGIGGIGAIGGQKQGIHCANKGGRGGDGGAGGHGSGGGGGCGGASFGIYTSGSSPPNYCSGLGNSVSGGSGGTAGAGGYSAGNSGFSGTNGSLTDCLLN
jgi:hypothetical protein